MTVIKQGQKTPRVDPPARERTDVLLGGLGVEIGEQAFAGLMQFALADDVVAIKHAARFVAEQDHGDPFGDTGPDEVARGGAPAVVQIAAGDVRGAAGSGPTGTPRPHGDAFAMEDDECGALNGCSDDGVSWCQYAVAD